MSEETGGGGDSDGEARHSAQRRDSTGVAINEAHGMSAWIDRHINVTAIVCILLVHSDD